MATKDKPENTKGTRVAKVTTRTRKKPLSAVKVASKSSEIIEKYISGSSPADLATEYSTTPENINLIVQRHWKALTNIRETRLLAASQSRPEYNHKDAIYFSLKTMQKAQFMNKKFLDKLSPDTEQILTDQEDLYCWTFVQTGDNLQAMKISGLDIGLLKDSSRDGRLEYAQACYLRGMYLRRKPNVAGYIQALKENKFLRSDVNKKNIQAELLELLDQLKSGNQSTTTVREQLRAVELLGKTVGAFTERIQIEKLDPAKALDYLDSLDQVNAQFIETVHESEELPMELPDPMDDPISTDNR